MPSPPLIKNEVHWHVRHRGGDDKFIFVIDARLCVPTYLPYYYIYIKCVYIYTLYKVCFTRGHFDFKLLQVLQQRCVLFFCKKKTLFGAVKVLKKFRMASPLYMRVCIDWKVDADVCTLKRSFLRILAVGSFEKTLNMAI